MSIRRAVDTGLRGTSPYKSVREAATASAVTANFSNTATGTYSSGGITYKYVQFTGNNTLTVTTAGFADILVVGGGSSGGGEYAANGAGGGVTVGNVFLAVGSYTVTIGAGGTGGGATGTGNPGNVGGQSRLGTFIAGNSFNYATPGFNAPYTSSITGSSVTYAQTGNAVTYGSGGIRAGCCGAPPGANGAAGVVVVRVEVW